MYPYIFKTDFSQFLWPILAAYTVIIISGKKKSNLFWTSLFYVGSRIRDPDPRSGMTKNVQIRDEHPWFATLIVTVPRSFWDCGSWTFNSNGLSGSVAVPDDFWPNLAFETSGSVKGNKVTQNQLYLCM
jgi:hypothetical protein